MRKIIQLKTHRPYIKDNNVYQNEEIQKLSRRLDKLEDFIDSEKKTKKLVFATVDTVHYFNHAEISHFCAAGSYSYLHTKDGDKILLSQTLKKTIEYIDGMGFVRIHQSFYINTYHIKKYIKKENIVVMTNGVELAVSRSKKNIINKIMII